MAEVQSTGLSPADQRRGAAAYMSDAAYLGPDATAVKNYLATKIPSQYGTWKLAWGPYEDFLSNSLFIASNDSGEYILACQGTISSVANWIEDLGAVVEQTWTYTVNPNANAIVAYGTWLAFSFMKGLKNPSGQNCLQFLNASQPKSIVVTGHSLGGGLANLFTVFLRNLLTLVTPLYSITFAAPTISNEGFRVLLNQAVSGGSSEQWQNQNDIIPMAWNRIPSILKSFPNGPQFSDFDLGIPYDIVWTAYELGGIPSNYVTLNNVKSFPGPGMGGLQYWDQEVSRQHSLESVYMPQVIPGYKPHPYEQQPEVLRRQTHLNRAIKRIKHVKKNLGIKTEEEV